MLVAGVGSDRPIPRLLAGHRRVRSGLGAVAARQRRSLLRRLGESDARAGVSRPAADAFARIGRYRFADPEPHARLQPLAGDRVAAAPTPPTDHADAAPTRRADGSHYRGHHRWRRGWPVLRSRVPRAPTPEPTQSVFPQLLSVAGAPASVRRWTVRWDAAGHNVAVWVADPGSVQPSAAWASSRSIRFPGCSTPRWPPTRSCRPSVSTTRTSSTPLRWTARRTSSRYQWSRRLSLRRLRRLVAWRPLRPDPRERRRQPPIAPAADLRWSPGTERLLQAGGHAHRAVSFARPLTTGTVRPGRRTASCRAARIDDRPADHDRGRDPAGHRPDLP